jgi:hypothetical protein
MPASDYPSKIALLGYFIENQQAGTADERDDWGQDLYDQYDAHIVQACAAATPPLDASAEARAIMAVMAAHAAGNRKQQAQRAVGGYLAYRGW